ncbi:restriction endonuclease subunit S [Actinobacillus succinogenes]|nr:restriction endonuclease subunit S [Actinobacillus succinogenes]
MLLSGEKRVSGFSGEWKIVKISDICNIGRGRVISKQEIEKNQGKYPVYSSQTLNNGVMGYLDSFDFDGEFVTWTTDGVNAGTIFYRNGKFNCTNVCGVLSSKLEQLNLRFLAYILSTVSYKYVSHTLANPKLMNGVMGTIEVKLPQLEEQQKIAEILTTADQEIETLQRKLECLKLEKRALMQGVF